MRPTTFPADAVALAEPATVVHFTGAMVSLDEHTIHRVRDSLFAVASEPGRSSVLLDFGNVRHVSSVALATLVSLHRGLLAAGRRLTVYNLGPEVYEAFALPGLDNFLDLRPAEQDGKPPGEGRPPEPEAGVLVVDDEPAVRSLLEVVLRREGLQAWSAAGGRQAVELCRAHPGTFGVALLDVLMPEMDGPQALAALRGLCPGLRWCFMTGGLGAYSERALLCSGAARVFRKPFELAEVIATVRRLLSPGARAGSERWIELPPQGA
jgi:anti-anti-sigma factor